MATGQAVRHESPETVALDMAASMEELARAGEWERVEDLAVRLRGAVMQVPEDRRRDVLLGVQRQLQQVGVLAEKHRGDVADRLTVLQRGRRAARAYTNTD